MNTIIFLGIMLNSITQTILVPLDKWDRALIMLKSITNKKKMTVLKLQQIAGLLNHISKAVVPGRPYVRKFHHRTRGLKQYHHVRVDQELRSDCQIWTHFLRLDNSVCHPFIDFKENTFSAEVLNQFSDASKACNLGLGGIFNNHWVFAQWEPGFFQTYDPSIKFLELHAVTVNIFLWKHLLKNRRVILFCDNEAVTYMINKVMSSNMDCLGLLRLITLIGLRHNTRYFVHHVCGKNNILTDLLSRMRIKKFKRLAPKSMDQNPHLVPPELWPVSKLCSKPK